MEKARSILHSHPHGAGKSPWPEKRVSMFYVRSKGDTEATRAQILKLMPENSVRSLSEYMSLMNSSNLPQLRPFTRTMVALGIVVSFLVVLLNMHTMLFGADTRDRHSQGARLLQARCRPDVAGRDSHSRIHGNRFGNRAYFPDASGFETDQPRADDSHFPCMALSRRRARSGGSRERSSLSRTSRRQLRSRRRPRLRMKPTESSFRCQAFSVERSEAVNLLAGVG